MSGFVSSRADRIGIVRRDLLLTIRRRADVCVTLFFFVIVASLFPLAISPDPAVLRDLGPGVLWIAALLACMLALPRLFAVDHADGSLEQMALAPEALPLIVLKKVWVHWLASGLPIVLLAPVIAVQYALPANTIAVLSLSLLLGTPVLSLVGAIGAALTLGVRGSDLLLPLLVMPLFIPVLVFGTGAVIATQTGMSPEANLSLLAAYLLAALVLAPIATAAAIRIALE